MLPGGRFPPRRRRGGRRRRGCGPRRVGRMPRTPSPNCTLRSAESTTKTVSSGPLPAKWATRVQARKARRASTSISTLRSSTSGSGSSRRWSGTAGAGAEQDVARDALADHLDRVEAEVAEREIGLLRAGQAQPEQKLIGAQVGGCLGGVSPSPANWGSRALVARSISASRGRRRRATPVSVRPPNCRRRLQREVPHPCGASSGGPPCRAPTSACAHAGRWRPPPAPSRRQPDVQRTPRAPGARVRPASPGLVWRGRCPDAVRRRRFRRRSAGRARVQRHRPERGRLYPVLRAQLVEADALGGKRGLVEPALDDDAQESGVGCTSPMVEKLVVPALSSASAESAAAARARSSRC